MSDQGVNSLVRLLLNVHNQSCLSFNDEKITSASGNIEHCYCASSHLLAPPTPILVVVGILQCWWQRSDSFPLVHNRGQHSTSSHPILQTSESTTLVAAVGSFLNLSD